MDTTININIKLHHVSCCVCGCVFGMEHDTYKMHVREHTDWFCPNGHQQHFITESREAQLKRQLSHARDMLLTERNSKNYYKNSARAQKAAKTRLKNRVKNGVCPCCNRTFQNLARHIETKHPEFKK